VLDARGLSDGCKNYVSDLLAERKVGGRKRIWLLGSDRPQEATGEGLFSGLPHKDPIGGGTGLLLKCHYETVRGLAYYGRSHPAFQTDDGTLALTALVPLRSCAKCAESKAQGG
jgi:hypothetical protein